MYNLFARYVYVVDDDFLLPRIALPCNETRAWFDVAVRARTLRDVVVVRDAPVARDTTPRDVVVAVVRGLATVVRDATLRAVFADGVAVVPRDTTFDVARRDVALVRGDCAVTIAPVVGAIGSANTARIDNNVEQTKNAPASKKTVPTAFLQQSAMLRLFINTLLLSGGTPGKPVI